MVDQAMGILKIEEIPTVIRMSHKGTMDNVFDKTSSYTSMIVYEALLCQNFYPSTFSILIVASLSYTLLSFVINLALNGSLPW